MSLVLVVVILDKTLVFQSETALSTIDAKLVPFGISRFTLPQACSVEIQEIPTRERTSLSLNEKSPPTRVEPVEDVTKPLGCSTLLAAPVAVYVLLLVTDETK